MRISRRLLLFIALLCWFLSFTSSYIWGAGASPDQLFTYWTVTGTSHGTDPPVISTLPSSLSVISEEAFAGTALESVFLPDSVVIIGERSFDNMPVLTSVYIPEETRYIEDNAFGSSGQVTIFSAPGSYAGKWAHRHGFHLGLMEIWLTDTSGMRRRLALAAQAAVLWLLTAIIIFLAKNQKFSPIVIRVSEFLSRLPQDRPELHAIEYRFP